MVGHASELPSKGDFVARTVGGGDLIFMRGRSGEIGAFFNSCTHRGTRICREKRGSAKSFACPYHGWVFNSDGKLVSMNAAKGFDADINADGALNLRKVPRLEQYRGFYFVNYNSAAINLVDYLAGATEFLDSMCDQTEAALVVLPGEHSYSINANFKYLCENSYDGYHLLPVQFTAISSSWTIASRPAAAREPSTSSQTFSTNKAGAVGWETDTAHWNPGCRPAARWRAGSRLGVRRDQERNRGEIAPGLEQRFGKERADFISDVQKNLVIFPNLVINDNVGMIVRTIEPVSATNMRVNSWALGPSDGVGGAARHQARQFP